MKTALVTGAAGFIGANLVRRLLAAGHHVTALVQPNSENWRLIELGNEIRILERDLSDNSSLAPILSEVKPNWIFHLAAYGGYQKAQDPFHVYRVNLQGTAVLLDTALQSGCESIVLAGSSSEYGRRTIAHMESMPPRPDTDYGVSKVAATLLGQAYAERHHLPVCTLRLYSVYGPFEPAERLLPTLYRYGQHQVLPPLVSADVARDFIYIDDVVDAFVQTASLGKSLAGQIFNIGTGKQSSLADVVEVARRKLHIAIEPQWGSFPDRPWDTPCWQADISKARSLLNWEPKYDLQQGFSAMCQWFEEHPELVPHYPAPKLNTP